jgi:hypothetical protein
MRLRFLCTSIVVATLVSGTAAAQQPDSAVSRPGSPQDSSTADPTVWLVGGSIGLPGTGREAIPELFTIGVQATELPTGRAAADFAIGTMPWALAEGVIGLGVRAGLAFPLASSRRLVFLPSIGASLAGVFGSGAGGALPGLNAGLALVVFGDTPTGLRVGTTFHRFRDAGFNVWLLELGFVRPR